MDREHLRQLYNNDHRLFELYDINDRLIPCNTTKQIFQSNEKEQFENETNRIKWKGDFRFFFVKFDDSISKIGFDFISISNK